MLLACVLGLAQITSQAIDFGVFDLRIAALNSNVHASVFGIASLLAQGAAAVAIAAVAIRSRRSGAWLVLATLVTLLLVVRVAMSYDAVVLLAPTAVVFLLYWRLTATESAGVRAVVRSGLLLLVFSFAVHAVGPTVVTWLGYSADSWAYQLKGILKHSAELAGWVLLATGVAVAARGAARAQRGA